MAHLLNPGYATELLPHNVTHVLKDGRVILATVFSTAAAKRNALICVGALPRP